MNARAGGLRHYHKFSRAKNEFSEGVPPVPFTTVQNMGFFHLAVSLVGAGILIIILWYWEAIKYEVWK